ncbi:MAG TPA: hypothetical protein VGS22_16530 [Thermoanaerobaculia bacterium]|jgi:hypothetical protein|nr:hypothetical protein [Thermoanaerobaculia bacterium]
MPTDRILLAIPPSLASGRLLLLAGDNADGRWSIEAPFLRPIDLRDYHRPITAEVIAELQSSYDPAGVYEAQFNFDHSWGGPSRGAIEGLEVRGEWLWLKGWVNKEVGDAVRRGEWPYLSAEIDPNHAATGKHYLTGMALLGSCEPAVWGQPKLAVGEPAPARLARQGGTGYLSAPHELLLLGAAERKEATMAAKTRAVTVPEDPASEPAESPAAEESVQLSTTARRVADLQRETQQYRRELAISRAELRLSRDLHALEAQITPAVLGVEGFRDLLMELAAEPETHKIQLAAGKGSTAERTLPMYDVLVAAFQKLPRFAALGSPELSAEPTEQDGEVATPTAYQASAGMTPERLAEIRRRIPGSHAKVN